MFQLGIYCRCVNYINVLYRPRGSTEGAKQSRSDEGKVWLVADCFRVFFNIKEFYGIVYLRLPANELFSVSQSTTPRDLSPGTFVIRTSSPTYWIACHTLIVFYCSF